MLVWMVPLGPRGVEAPTCGHTAAWNRGGLDPQAQELVAISRSQDFQSFTPDTNQEAVVPPVLFFDHTIELFSVDSEI